MSIKRGIHKECLCCHKEFYVQQSLIKRKKYCSEVCFNKHIGTYRCRGKIGWNKGLHIKMNNALEEWHKKGGVVWNKGMKGFMAGDKSPSWKGGRRKTSDGYLTIHNPKHKNANSVGCVLEHRLIMEEKIGRFLEYWEVVHHINGNRLDNRLDNLELMTWAQHSKYHAKNNKYFKKRFYPHNKDRCYHWSELEKLNI